ncbi:polyribonucleotide nucleotidyltransferase [Striga asiatica]|uniref:Polyribonucleotide nucleotidyltransferase n=1 Tax=Striga asiatica TaxID=4170 RepID=A0A5A7R7W1_STRAF|nr:polyribonucleotide nucleotidyltransferase [Striga asiatica]
MNEPLLAKDSPSGKAAVERCLRKSKKADCGFSLQSINGKNQSITPPSTFKTPPFFVGKRNENDTVFLYDFNWFPFGIGENQESPRRRCFCLGRRSSSSSINCLLNLIDFRSSKLVISNA